MKAQSSIEYLALFASLLFVLLLVSAFFYSNFQVQYRVSQAELAVDKLSNAVDAVAAQGPGSSKYVTVYFPQNIITATAGGREVFIKMAGSSGQPTDVARSTFANITSVQLPLSEGRYTFTVTFQENGNVSISG